MPYDKEYNKKWREANKEKIKEYRENNKEKIKEYDKEYYEENKEKIRQHQKEYTKKYNEENKDKIKQRVKEYRKTEAGKKTNRITRWKQLKIKSDDYNSLYEYFINCKNCELCNVQLVEGLVANGKCLDHEHSTGLVRNVLCRSCNIKRR